MAQKVSVLLSLSPALSVQILTAQSHRILAVVLYVGVFIDKDVVFGMSYISHVWVNYQV